jgi:hypothetical protein
MRQVSSYRVVRAEAGAHARIVQDLWARNLRNVGDVEAKYRWQLLNCPYNESHCLLIENEGEPVGAVSIGARRLHVNGSVSTVGVIGDFVIDQQHRLAQPALMLQRAVMSCLDDGFRMLYGIPNTLALPLMKRVGYEEAALIHRYARPLDLSSYFSRDARTRALPSWVVSVANGAYGAYDRGARAISGSLASSCAKVNNIDGAFDDLWERVKREPVAMGVRDSKYLRWRFAGCPLRSYTMMGLFAGGGRRLNGYMVFYEESGALACVDLLVAGGQREMRALILDAARYARRAGLHSMQFAGVLTPKVLEALRSCQFRRRTALPVDTAAKASGKPAARTLMIHTQPGDPLMETGWYVTGSDEDND